MNKNKHFRKSLLAVLTVLIIALIITATTLIESYVQLDTNSAVSIIISSVETILLLVSLVIAIAQLYDSKEISRGNFITELNKSFVENDDYTCVYNHLQNCKDDCCDCGTKCCDRLKITADCNLDLTKGQISNYLTFFETIYILNKRKVIDFDILNDLFAYRFFLAVHSKIVQQKKLKIQPQNFKNIFCLEYLWLKYRKDHNIVSTDENSVYTHLLLEELVGKDIYKKLTKDCR